MKLIDTPAVGAPAGVPRHMTRSEQAWCDFKRWMLWKRRRYIPYFVWWQDELDVVVTFSREKLDPDDPSPVGRLFDGDLHYVEESLRLMGIKFDRGMGWEGRDWEWDYSLSGPISVRFKGRAATPHLRRERPKPKLVGVA